MSTGDPPELSPFTGRWAGTWRTWVEPGVLHSHSAIEAKFETILGGMDLTHEYRGTIGDEPVEGFALIGASPDGFTVAWVDSWHTSGLVLVSVGAAQQGGFAVSTEYRAEDAVWRWSTEYSATPDQVVVRHYNEGPDLERYLGVEAVLDRAG